MEARCRVSLHVCCLVYTHTDTYTYVYSCICKYICLYILVCLYTCHAHCTCAGPLRHRYRPLMDSLNHIRGDSPHLYMEWSHSPKGMVPNFEPKNDLKKGQICVFGSFLGPNGPFRLFSHHILCPTGLMKE